MLYLDDCLNTLKSLEKNSVDLIYLDPPFFSQKIQKLSKADRYYEFNDIWKSREEYLNYIKKRLIVMRDVLKDSGSIFPSVSKGERFSARMTRGTIKVWPSKSALNPVVTNACKRIAFPEINFGSNA